MENPMLSVMITYLCLILMLATVAISHLFSNRWIWISIICGLFAGLLLGIVRNGFPNGLLSGIIFGVLIDLFIIPSGLWVKYKASGKGRNISITKFINKKAP